jgi:biotin/methionine sulfoxide reductase
MGVESEFTAEKTSDDWIKWLYMETRKKAVTLGLEMPSYEEFDDKGWFKFSDPKEKIVMLEDFRKDPIKNRLKTPSGRIEIYSEVVANFGYQDCPGHAVWREPCEWLGNNQTKFPLHLISNQPDNKLHSQLDHGSYSRASKIDGREPIRINSLDATKRNLKPNDLVLVFNDRGSCLAAVVVDDGIRSGVALMSTGAWYDPLDPSIVNSTCKNGNPNVLTPDKGTSSLAQGPIAHTCLVEIKLVNEPMPKVTAYDPPKIVRKDG